MNEKISSPETITDIPLRRNVDIGPHLPDLEKAASEDSYIRGSLYTIPEFTREIIGQFVRIRDYHRSHGLPLLTPAEVADNFINKTTNSQ